MLARDMEGLFESNPDAPQHSFLKQLAD